MDQSEAVERNRQALLSVVAALLSVAGLSAERSTLPRRVYRTILRLLRPAESAARRLVIALAQGLDVGAAALRPHRWGSARRSPEMLARSAVTLPLFDQFKTYRHQRRVSFAVPRISTPGLTPLFAITPRLEPRPGDHIDATRLRARLAALQIALNDPARYAARMARWMALRAHRAKTWQWAESRRRRFQRISPLRPGRCPGQLLRSCGAKERHRVHDILEHAHELALYAMERRDTS